MRIFRNLRVNSLETGSLKKYLKYAVGEIILVVIGILIAFQISTYGQRVKKEEKIKNILKIVEENLKKDTAELSAVINQYEKIRPFIKRLLKDSVSNQEVDTSKIIGTLIFSYSSFNMSDMGYLLLKNEESIFTHQRDFDISEITSFYSSYMKHIKRVEIMIKEDVESNIRYYGENYDWFYTTFTPEQKEFKAHVLKSPKFKNKLVIHSLLVYSNYIPMLKSYKESATSILEKLHQLN